MACGGCMNIVPHAITINQTSIVTCDIYREIVLMLFSVFFQYLNPMDRKAFPQLSMLLVCESINL